GRATKSWSTLECPTACSLSMVLRVLNRVYIFPILVVVVGIAIHIFRLLNKNCIC
ncbi:hypothetical protein B0H14DRAFT_2379973, partial [Mycena olivaceomarginata]